MVLAAVAVCASLFAAVGAASAHELSAPDGMNWIVADVRGQNCQSGQTVHIITRSAGTGNVYLLWNPGSHSEIFAASSTPHVTFTGAQSIDTVAFTTDGSAVVNAIELQCHGVK